MLDLDIISIVVKSTFRDEACYNQYFLQGRQIADVAMPLYGEQTQEALQQWVDAYAVAMDGEMGGLLPGTYQMNEWQAYGLWDTTSSIYGGTLTGGPLTGSSASSPLPPNNCYALRSPTKRRGQNGGRKAIGVVVEDQQDSGFLVTGAETSLQAFADVFLNQPQESAELLAWRVNFSVFNVQRVKIVDFVSGKTIGYRLPLDPVELKGYVADNWQMVNIVRHQDTRDMGKGI